MPPELLAELDGVDGVEWVNLQKGHSMPATLEMRNAEARVAWLQKRGFLLSEAERDAERPKHERNAKKEGRSR